jgi:hypothetical protein
MNHTSREIQLSLMLGGSGILLALLLFKTQSMMLPWMPVLMMILTVGSIGCLLLGLLGLLRGRENYLNLLVRLVSFASGILFLSMIFYLNLPNKFATQNEVLMETLLLGPAGLLLSAFGLCMEFWLVKVLKINRWAIYRYAVRLLCFSCALAMTSFLVLDNGFYTLSHNDPLTFRRFIIYSIVFSGFGLGLNPWERYLCAREKES